MKKMLFSAIALIAFTATSMAGEIVENNSSKQSKAIEEKILENSASEEEVVGCSYSTTTIFYRVSVKKVISMDTSVTAFEVTLIIDRICTTCYQMGNAGVTVTTACN